MTSQVVDILLSAINGLMAQSKLEWLAMLLGLAYLVLIVRKNVLAWPCAFFSTAIYIFIFWDASLLMESALNVYYLAMAVYGFWHWSRARHQAHSDVVIIRWPLKYHVAAISGIVLVSVGSGFLLQERSQAAWPYLDSFTTWGAVFTTYLVAQKVYENWYYWLIIDSVALFLYIDRALYPTALLMSIYLVIIVFGIISWRKTMAEQANEAM